MYQALARVLNDTIFASELNVIYYGSPCKSHTDQPLILYLFLKYSYYFLTEREVCTSEIPDQCF